VFDSENGKETDSRFPAGRRQRPRQSARQLAVGEPGDGGGAEVHGLRLQIRVRHRRSQRQTRRRDPARFAALVVAGLSEVTVKSDRGADREWWWEASDEP